MNLEQIGLYRQLTPFTNENAGTAEWCKAEKDHTLYFVKKFQSPVYPSKDLGLPEKKYQARVARFHAAEQARKTMYRALRENDTSGTLVVPVEVMNYQYHICTIAEYISGNIAPEQVCRLSEWQRLVLMRTLTLALINVHRAGVVHSDMKPQNVLITQNPMNGICILKLIDFDGSFMEENPPEHITGDPAYSAPEIYRCSTEPDVRLDRKIDVFALGIVLHYFWAGSMPKTGSGRTLGESALNGDGITLDPSVPPSLQDVIRQTLEADPAKRPQAGQVYTALEKPLAEYPVKMVSLVKGGTAESPGKTEPGRSGASGSRRGFREKAPDRADSTARSVEVLHIDENGWRLRTETITVVPGKSVYVYAKDIPGYHLVSDSYRIEVFADRDSPVRFCYGANPRKKHPFAIIFSVLLAAFLLYTAVMYAFTLSEYNSGRYWVAYQYMQYTPFFSDFCPEQSRYLNNSGSVRTLSLSGDDLFARETAVIIQPGKTARFSFTPSVSGYYSFTSDAGPSVDTKCSLVRGGDDLGQDDSSGRGSQFFLRRYLEKGVKYQWRASFASRQQTGSFDVILTRDADMITENSSMLAKIGDGGAKKLFCFVPETTRQYTFRSTGSLDTRGRLYDSRGQLLAEDDDISQEDHNFRIDYRLQAGNRYFYVVWLYENNNTGIFNVRLE